MHLDPAQLAALAAILRSGSFERAAHDLGVTQSAVSQRLKALETRVGALLVHRGQPCTGTATGRRLAAHADRIGLLEADLARDVAALAPAPRTRLRIAVNADSLATWFPDALAGMPQHLFELVIDDQDVSHDWLRRGEAVGAVTASDQPVAGCNVVPLGALRYIPTASPEFMARHFPQGVTADAIARAPMLQFNVKDRLQHNWIERVFGRAISPPSHLIASPEGFVRAARLGLGWGLNPETLVTQEIAAGQLVSLLPGAHFDTPLYWQSGRLLAEALAPLTRSIRKAARGALRPRG
ncbi:LysR family transcriptional regulator ArgP [Aquicoccus porphyridii]|uniref:LysR family transcriptional regulator ArgP n=1 Tax=Aquicoccus porphyridii TaxID=1852029 RepID=UPI00273DB91B|nr:LysR family transcriptional regulator ArgP [Aquicoccus porphyridii]